MAVRRQDERAPVREAVTRFTLAPPMTLAPTCASLVCYSFIASLEGGKWAEGHEG